MKISRRFESVSNLNWFRLINEINEIEQRYIITQRKTLSRCINRKKHCAKLFNEFDSIFNLPSFKLPVVKNF